jgi:lipoprotein-anchoring transpeptidase ErfK/SrfK
MSNTNHLIRAAGAALALAGAALWSTAAQSQTQSQMMAMSVESNAALAYQGVASDEAGVKAEAPARLRRQIVDYTSAEAPGTIIIDTPNTYLYFVLGGGKAVRYGIGVGREGFTWSGIKTIERKSEWPDWIPPTDMLQRQPYLPRFMAGGPGNPLGARAMYLSGTVYRIHGTNAPATIGKHGQRRRHRPLQPHARGHQGRRAADGPASRRGDRADTADAHRPRAGARHVGSLPRVRHLLSRCRSEAIDDRGGRYV